MAGNKWQWMSTKGSSGCTGGAPRRVNENRMSWTNVRDFAPLTFSASTARRRQRQHVAKSNNRWDETFAAGGYREPHGVSRRGRAGTPRPIANLRPNRPGGYHRGVTF